MTEQIYLQHHGILGMKWGIRRFQNKDGTRTEEGKKRYQENKPVKEKKQISKSTIAYGATVAAIALGTVGSYVLYTKNEDKWYEVAGKTQELADKGQKVIDTLSPFLSVYLAYQSLFGSRRKKEKTKNV